MAKQESTSHYLTRNELAENLFNPTEGKDQFPALQSELDSNGNLKFDAVEEYTNRFLSENPDYKNILKENEEKIVGAPSFGDMLSVNLKNIPDMLDGAYISSRMALYEGIKGTTEDTLPYVSQEEYRKRKVAGESTADIFPHLTKTSARTFTDWTKWALNPIIKMDPMGINLMEKTDELDDPDKFFPNASERLLTREAWYNQGGEVGPDGRWYTINESRNERGQKIVQKQESKFTQFWTPLEYKTEEAYEKRKNESAQWGDNIYNVMRQKFAYEYMDPSNDEALANFYQRRLDKNINNPKFQELSEWSKSVEWSEAFESGQLGKKIVNAVTGALPSYLVQMAAGGSAYALTKSPNISMSVAAFSGAALDASDMFTDAYKYLTDKGFSDVEAKGIALQHFEQYFLASMALERLPFMLALRRINKDPAARRAYISKIFGDKFKQKVDNIAAQKVVGGVTGDNILAISGAAMAQGIGESVTEIAQYTTQMAMQTGQPIDEMYGYKLPFTLNTGGYRDDKKFDDLADINQLLDAAVGGFGMGGITGLATPQVTEEQIKPTAPPGSRIEAESPSAPEAGPIFGDSQQKNVDKKVKYTDDDSEGASPTDSKPIENEVDYLNEIVTKQILTDDPDQVGSSIVTDFKKRGVKGKLADIAKNHQSQKFEEVPISKVVDIVKNYGMDIINKLPLNKDQKSQLELEVLAEIKRKKSFPLKNKKNLNTTEQERLNRIDDLTVEQLIEAGKNNVDVDRIINLGFDRAIKKQEQNIVSKAQDQDIVVDENQGVSQEQIDTAGVNQSLPKNIERKKSESISGVKAPVAKSSKDTKESPADKITRQLSEQQSILKTYKNQLNKAPANKKPAIQKNINKVKARIETLNKQLPDNKIDSKQEIDKEIEDSRQEDTKKKTKVSDVPEDSNYYIQSEKSIVSKLSNPKLEKLIKEKENSKDSFAKTDLKALKNEKAKRAEAKAKKKPSKAAKETTEIDSPNYYIDSEKSIVSKLSNTKINTLLKSKESVKSILSNNNMIDEANIIAADLKALNNEKARREEAKKEKQDVPVKSKEDIKMEEGDDLIFQQYLENNKMGNVRDVNSKSETSAGLTKDEQQDLDNNVEETKDELNKKNCQTKGGS